MTRVKVKGTGIRARSNPDEEPNFWAMKWMDGGNVEAHRIRQVAATTEANTSSIRDDSSTFVTSNGAPSGLVPSPAASDTAFSSAFGIPLLSSSGTSMSIVSQASSTGSLTPRNQDANRNYEFLDPRSSAVSPSESSLSSQHHLVPPPAAHASQLFEPEPLYECEGRQGRLLQQEDCVLTGWGKPFHYLGAIDVSSHRPNANALPALPISHDTNQSVDILLGQALDCILERNHKEENGDNVVPADDSSFDQMLNNFMLS